MTLRRNLFLLNETCAVCSAPFGSAPAAVVPAEYGIPTSKALGVCSSKCWLKLQSNQPQPRITKLPPGRAYGVHFGTAPKAMPSAAAKYEAQLRRKHGPAVLRGSSDLLHRSKPDRMPLLPTGSSGLGVGSIKPKRPNRGQVRRKRSH